MTLPEQSDSPYGEPWEFEVNENGRNKTWIVCRECLAAWPPNDIKPGHRHCGDGEDEAGFYPPCAGRPMELADATPLRGSRS